MIVMTHRFGVEEQVEVPDEQLYDFRRGLGAFEGLHRYALIVDPDSPVEWLQSLDDEHVVFALLEPFVFQPGFEFELPDADALALRLDRPEDAMVRSILAMREDPEEITANLLAPLVLNPAAGLGGQVLLQDSDWPLRVPVFEALERASAASASKEAVTRVSAA